MSDTEPARSKPKVADPEHAAERIREMDIDPETAERVTREIREREEREARELFGDQKPFPYPDTDTDA